MSYCDNCGKESHCGTNATIRVNADEIGINEVVICKNCRCNKCSKIKDTKNEL